MVKKDKNKKYPEGHFIWVWMAIGIVIFSVIGIPLSIVTGNLGLIGIGPALGISIGLSIGAAIEEKMKKAGRIRLLTKKERKSRQIAVAVGIIFLLLGVVLFSFIYFLR